MSQPDTPAGKNDPLERAERDLERAEASADDERLEILEELRSDLEAELETSVENESPRR
jgi:hypothetical protein